jgi:hypothetical protein
MDGKTADEITTYLRQQLRTQLLSVEERLKKRGHHGIVDKIMSTAHDEGKALDIVVPKEMHKSSKRTHEMKSNSANDNNNSTEREAANEVKEAKRPRIIFDIDASSHSDNQTVMLIT